MPWTAHPDCPKRLKIVVQSRWCLINVHTCKVPLVEVLRANLRVYLGVLPQERKSGAFRALRETFAERFRELAVLLMVSRTAIIAENTEIPVNVDLTVVHTGPSGREFLGFTATPIAKVVAVKTLRCGET